MEAQTGALPRLQAAEVLAANKSVSKEAYQLSSVASEGNRPTVSEGTLAFVHRKGEVLPAEGTGVPAGNPQQLLPRLGLPCSLLSTLKEISEVCACCWQNFLVGPTFATLSLRLFILTLI